jgi:two-component system chemotaxis response regulator CheY
VYTIGDISKIVNVSANTLRYYDEIGILKPCMVQSNNQYRYYSDSQIKEIAFILELKQYGFSLDEIKILLKDKSNQKLKPMLEEKRVELSNEIERLKERYVFLEKRISNIDQKEELKMKECRVLIVDDFALARKVIRNVVEEYGYSVVDEVSNGEEAIAAYDALKPELVIMDITMPKMDGIDAAANIMEKYNDARIIMCSAMSQAPIILESIKVGARDFITKPISNFRLIQALERVLDDKHSFRLERVNNFVSEFEKSWRGKAFGRTLKQEEIDLLFFSNVNESNQNEVISNIYNKVEFNSLNEHEYFTGSPLKVELKTIAYLEGKFSELLQGGSRYFSSRFNNECTMKLITVENITISEFRTLLFQDSELGIIKRNISSLPILINVLGDFGSKKEILGEILDFISKNLYRVIPDFNAAKIIMSHEADEVFNENYSTILISFSIEFDDGDKDFVMLSLPHDCCNN